MSCGQNKTFDDVILDFGKQCIKTKTKQNKQKQQHVDSLFPVGGAKKHLFSLFYLGPISFFLPTKQLFKIKLLKKTTKQNKKKQNKQNIKIRHQVK